MLFQAVWTLNVSQRRISWKEPPPPPPLSYRVRCSCLSLVCVSAPPSCYIVRGGDTLGGASKSFAFLLFTLAHVPLFCQQRSSLPALKSHGVSSLSYLSYNSSSSFLISLFLYNRALHRHGGGGLSPTRRERERDRPFREK